MNHLLGQGATKIAHVGDTIVNVGTTICGLVLAFTETSDEVACYHFPFMECNTQHMSKLTSIVGQIGPISRIIIITNDYNDEKDKICNHHAAKQIRSYFGVKTTYLIQTDTMVDDIHVRLKKDGIVMWAPTREEMF